MVDMMKRRSSLSTQELELRVLELLSAKSGPQGASSLQHDLGKSGIRVGEATVGRLLRLLDRRGLTLKHGKLGRTLTTQGERELQALLRHHERREGGYEFLSALDEESPTVLLDVLVGRRAIERETAGLAALRATNADIEMLRRNQAEHERSKHRGDSAVRENREFHLAIARIAGNRVLATALELLLKEVALSETIVHVREVAGARLGIEHPRIIEAIALRDAGRASKAMSEHINQIIRDLYRTHEHVFRRQQREASDYLL